MIRKPKPKPKYLIYIAVFTFTVLYILLTLLMSLWFPNTSYNLLMIIFYVVGVIGYLVRDLSNLLGKLGN